MRNRIKRLMDKVNEVRAEAHAIVTDLRKMGADERRALLDTDAPVLLGQMANTVGSPIGQFVIEAGKSLMLSTEDLNEIELYASKWNAGCDAAKVACPCDECAAESKARKAALN